MEAIIVLLVIIAVIAGAVIYSSMSWGYVLVKFWTWFLMPVFPQIHQILFWQAVGLMFIIGLFHNADIENSIKSEYTSEHSGIIKLIMGPWITLICGWIMYSMFIH